ncbi:MAG: rane fusion protein heavy metal efflux system [Burkholderiales bacterium]
MNRKTKIIFGTATVVLAAVTVIGAKELTAPQEPPAAAHAGSGGEPGVVRYAAGAPQLSSIGVHAVAEEPMPVAEPSNARVAYDENVTARVSSPVAGRVTALRAEIGEEVSRNAALVEIDSPDFAAAEADWRKAEADEVRKKLAFERSGKLLENEVIARKDYESAEADYRQAVAETQRARLRLRNLNAAGSGSGRFLLKAPLAGVVADKQVNPGQEVRPDLPNPLFVITDITRLWVIIDLPERNLGNIHPGQAVSIETDAYPDQRFAGKVERIGLALDPTTRRVQVRCSVRNPDKRLKPEMFARVSFVAEDGNKAVRVPNTGLIVNGIDSYVFVEKQPGVFERRRVNVALRGADSSFVDRGVASGERVVTEGTLLLNSEVSSDAR